jgi:hypothetical protein
MGTAPGLAFLVLGILVFMFWITPLLLVGTGLPKLEASSIATMAGPGLLSACILTIILGDDKVLRFAPAEVDFLFPGPFTRRELMSYKLFENVVGASFAALFFFVWIVPHVPLALAAYWGAFQGLLFIQLFQVVATLSGQTIMARVQTINRLWIIVGLAILVALIVWQSTLWLTTPSTGGLWQSFRESPGGTILLAPFDVFGQTMAAANYLDLLVWGGTALGINVVLLSLILRLDQFYVEAALASSQRFLAIMQRFRRGGVLSVWGSPLRYRVPSFGRVAGLGPVAWHQLTAAARSVPTLLSLGAVILFVIIAPQFLFERAGQVSGGTIGITAAVIQMTIIFTLMLQFDFRSDLDQLEWLKTMPVSPMAVAAGQLVVPVLLGTLVQGGLILGLAVSSEDPLFRALLFSMVPFVLPLNLLLFALENYLFLVYPTRSMGFRPGDFQGLIRQVVLFVVKLALMFVAGLLASLSGVMLYLGTHSVLAGVVTGWTVLLLMALALVPLVGRAYDRFDPSTDRPA